MPDSAAAATPDPVDRILADWKSRPGPLLPILHAIQAELGHIPKEAVARIARALNLSRADVHGVITFYHDFHTEPRARHVVRVCRAEACQAMGAVQLEAHVKSRCEGRADVELEPVYCLGNCACGPAMMIDDHIYARVDAATFDGLLARHTGAPGKGKGKKP